MSAEELLSKFDEGTQELTIKEEYQLWRKNCRYMYEFVTETALTWPSLTVQWLPNHTSNEADGVIDCKLLLGTHTSGEDVDYLKVAQTQLPANKSQQVSVKSTSPTNGKDDATKTKDSKSAHSSRVKIIRKFKNGAEINRARYMPQDSSIVATINGKGDIDLYNIDSSKDSSNSSIAQFQPHTDNGYGISWSPFQKGHLLSSSDDKSIVITDTNTKLEVFKNTTASKDIVNDSKFHPLSQNVFGTVSEDKFVHIFDLRVNADKPVSSYYSEDSKGINSLAFSPFSTNLMAIGNTNSNICLLDIRKMSSSSSDGLLHTLMGHSASITSLEFSPHKDGILASGSEDRRLILWDLSKTGEEQTQEDAEDGCPELFMMHAGHTGSVMDLNWCPYKDWTLASVADDNIVHLWEVGKSILNDKVEIDINELE
ncbi:histone acetyltransferase type B subunit 2 [[Candida] railenensis]|uniref:Histone acetyltransferase type B subunit 2 n=1 Tax=[Candida] railenensis TaxID=45579 RepID=A0A9P0W036_9ASCO|nr:histone acetyltransferase type B subunit 2 [[Candida] railenensis]